MNPTNLKDGKRVVVMHGENWLIPVDAMPEGATTKCKVFIAGHSESGHNHVIESSTEMEVIEGDTRAVLLHEVGKLFHKKSFDIHETAYLAPGAYIINHKTEYNPFIKIVQKVWD
jgi:hypothetical protein